MNNILEYKGYHTRIEYNTESNTLRGKIEGINDFVDFECNNLLDVEKEFHNAVDDYLMFCESIGAEPDKEYKGTFNIRIAPELHKRLAAKAFKDGSTLNSEVELAISKFVNAEITERELFAKYVTDIKARHSYNQYFSGHTDQSATVDSNKILYLSNVNKKESSPSFLVREN